MRKKFNLLSLSLLILFSLAVSTVSAQTVPGNAVTNGFQVADPSFENWDEKFNGQPALGGGSTGANTGKGLWYGANVYKDVGIKVYGQVAHKEAGRLGGYAAKLIDTEVGAMGITEVSPAWITLGTPWSFVSGLNTNSATAGTDGGVSFTHRPDTMSVWIKRYAPTPENFNLVYYAWKGTAKGHKYKAKGGDCQDAGEHIDEESDIRRVVEENLNSCGTDVEAEQVAEGYYGDCGNKGTKITYGKQYANWTEIKVPIVYTRDVAPEKMNIILSASPYPEGRRTDGLNKGNYLIVDDLSLVYSSQIYVVEADGRALPDFNKDVYNYTIELPEDATDASVPANIVGKRSGRKLSGSEISITNPRKLGEPITIVVKAEDNSSTSTYTLTYIRKKSVNAQPKAILVNGTHINGFSGSLTTYDVALPYGTTGEPVITIEKGQDAQTYTVQTCANFPCAATVTVTAEDTSVSKTYTLNFSVAELSDATLQDIKVNGVSIPGFTPNKFSYKVSVPLETTQEPELEAVSKYAPGAQKITITKGGLDGESTIKVEAPSGASRTYKITYVKAKSDYKYLKDLTVDGQTIAGFAYDKQDYTYPLPLGTTQLPVVGYEQGDAYQTVTITNEGLEGTTRVAVKAQNGDTYTYRIKFSVEKSTNTLLNNILVDGVALPGFKPEQKDYTFNVAATATTRPVVTWEQGDAYQVVTKNPASEASASINGVTKLTVKAQNGSVMVYSITFTQTLSDNSKLADLWVEGASLSPAFTADNLAYTCQLSRGTVSLPAIGYTKGDATQVVRIDENGVNGTAKITVKAQTGATTVYTIAFSVYASSNASLANILLDGVSLKDFDPATLRYNVTLESGTTTLPQIEAVKGDEAQRVIITKGGVNGTTYVRVIAENGDEQTYSLIFEVEKSLNATLTDLLVGGVSLPGFDPNTMEYRYILSDDATACPVVEAVGTPEQTITITMPQLTGTAYIEVQPEVGGKNIYTIRFTYNQSDNNLLSDLTVGGNTIEGFDAATNVYEVTLPVGTTQLPTIGYTSADSKQTVQVVEGGLNAPTYIYVVAEDGSVNTYQIKFKVALSDETLLENILLDGIQIDGFASDKFDYSVILSDDATELPQLTYVKRNEAQQVSVSMPALTGKAILVVTSPDKQKSQTYQIAFDYATQTDASLNDILVNGVSIFEEGKTDYQLTVSEGAAKPAVTFEKKHATQQVVVNNQGLLGATLTVTAQDGTQLVYTISYVVEPSNVALLRDIKLYDEDAEQFVSIAGFAADKFDYDVQLPWRATFVPAIQPVASTKGQVITLSEGGVNGETTIHVWAQNGTDEAVYTLRFATQKSDVNTLAGIMVDDQPLDDFDAEKVAYEIELPYDATDVPEVSYLKELPEQTVVVTEGGLNEATTIKVIAENGSEKVYTLTYKVATTCGKDNVLRELHVGGENILQPGVFAYEFTLPYGESISTLPQIEYFKNYEQQTVHVVQTPVGYTVTVKSNQEGVADAVYTIRYKTTPNTAKLTGLSLAEGTLYPAFRPDLTSYVAKISNYNGVTPVCDDQNTITVLESTAKKYQIKVSSKANANISTVYTVYFYYQGDVIPNGEFTEWGKATYNNADKPVSWQVPADAAKSYSTWGTTYTTGNEVKNAGNGIATLNTTYMRMGIGGSVPGMMTLGSIAMKLDQANKSTSSVSGGISFRNSPDYIDCRYQYAKSTNVNNIRIVYTLEDQNGAVYAPEAYVDKATGDWKSAHIRITNDEVSVPKTMNLIINAGHSENCSSIGGSFLTEASSTMHVDYVRFEYSSTINSIKVNGVDATKTGNTFTAVLDYEGTPELSFVGEVEDQGYGITWGEEKDGVRTATVICYAENPDQTTTYTVKVERPKTDLTNVYVGGAALDGFTPENTQYTTSVACTARQMPDVHVVSGSSQQAVEITTENNLTLPMAQEKNSVINIAFGAKTYTVQVQKAKSSDATLQNIWLDGIPVDDFRSDNLSYEVSFAEGTTEAPEVSYLGSTVAQVITVTDNSLVTGATIHVLAEDGKTSQTYTLTYKVAQSATTAQLANLKVLNASALSFAADTYEYTTQLNEGETQAAVWYAKLAASDTLQMVLTDDTVSVTLKNSAAVINTYKIALATTPSDNANLNAIRVDGVMAENFDPETDECYTVARQGMIIEPELAEEGQTLAVAFDESLQTYSFTVTAPAGNSKTYNLILQAPVRTNADLAGIWVNDVLIEGFDKDTLAYNYTIPCDMPKWAQPAMPDLKALAAAEAQVITYELGDVDDETYITVEAKDGAAKAATKTYSIKFATQKSSYAYLADLAVNYVTVDGFALDAVKEDGYLVQVPIGAAKPVVTYQKGDAFQQVTESDNGNQHTVTVTAEDGTTKVYTINFATQFTGNANLADILIDNVSLEGFAPDKYDNYPTIELAVGTTTLPEIKAISGAAGQVISIQNGGVNGVTVIKVTADDGVTTNEYRISFAVKLSENALLSDVWVGEESVIANFDPALTYTHNMPVTPREWPMITWIPGDIYQTVDTAETVIDTWNKQVVLNVAAQDGVHANTYTINLQIAKSDVDTLQAIYFDDVEYELFDPNATDTLVCELPVGTTEYPTVTYKKGDEFQSVADPIVKDNVVTLNVTAENGAERTYVVKFIILHSSDATLKNIYVGYNPLAGFNPDTLSYNYVLPYGTTELPVVEVEASEPTWQKINQQPGGVNGDYIIHVLAEDGITNREYVIHFSVAKSDNALLKDLLVAGQSLDGFDGETFVYTYPLPYGSTSVLAVEGVKMMDTQTIEITQAATPADTTYLVVTAEDGITNNTYKVVWEVEKSSNANLQMIYYNGIEVPDFDPENTYYENIELPYGTTEKPVIEWIQGDKDQTVSVEQTGNTAIVKVVAQDGTVNEYQLTFVIAKSDENRLKNLFVNGVSVPSFNPDSTRYEVIYPFGTLESELATIEDVTYEVFDPIEDVQLLSSEDVLLVRVTAENGSVRVYEITQTIALSDNTRLDDILINGESIPGFDPDVLGYVYWLPYGSASVPSDITYVSSDTTQTISMSINQLGELTKIYVTAQDGTEAIYTIQFNVDDFDPSTTPTAENVCVTSRADNSWKFTTNCNNVVLYLSTLDGKVIMKVHLPLVDPNVKEICSEEANGFIFDQALDRVVAYYFVHQNKTIVKSGKIRVSQH